MIESNLAASIHPLYLRLFQHGGHGMVRGKERNGELHYRFRSTIAGSTGQSSAESVWRRSVLTLHYGTCKVAPEFIVLYGSAGGGGLFPLQRGRIRDAGVLSALG